MNIRFEVFSFDEAIEKEKLYDGLHVYIVGVPIEQEEPKREEAFLKFVNDKNTRLLSFVNMKYFETLCPRGFKLLENVEHKIENVCYSEEGIRKYIIGGNDVIDYVNNQNDKKNRFVVLAPGSVFIFNQTPRAIYNSDIPFIGYLDATSSFDIIYRDSCKILNKVGYEKRIVSAGNFCFEKTVAANECLIICCLNDFYRESDRNFKDKKEGSLFEHTIFKLRSFLPSDYKIVLATVRERTVMTLDELHHTYSKYIKTHSNIVVFID